MFLLSCFLLSCAKPVPPAPVQAVDAQFTVLSINDTYRIEGRQESGAGGMALVRQLRAGLEEEGPVLVLHGGDLLYPSLLSQRYDGRQMVDMLGWLDGDGDTFDPHLFVTLGNHEFDRDDLDDAAVLSATMAGADFTWLSTNIRWVEDADGAPLVAADNLQRTAIVDIGGARVGLFGLTGDFKQPDYVAAFEDPVETARATCRALRQAGANLVIAVTHLDAQDDIDLLDQLGDAGPDLVVGGHDHVAMIRQAASGRYVVKADADAVSAVVTQLQLGASGLAVDPEIISLDMGLAPDPQVAGKVQQWLVRHERAFCEDVGESPPCLDTPLGRVTVALVAEETAIRSAETSLGDWVADLALQHFADQGAQVAFLNSGGLRLDKDLPAGSELTRRHLEELLPYPTGLRLIRIDADTLDAVVQQSAAGWPGSGNWLQIAGMAFRHDPASNNVDGLRLLGPDGPVRPQGSILAVTNSYLAGGGDGYDMLAGAPVVAEGPDLRQVIEAALHDARAAGVGVGPGPMGRICQGVRDCLLD